MRLKPRENSKLRRLSIIAAVWGCALVLTHTPALAEGGAKPMDTKFLARLFVQAEETTGISRHLFAAIAAQESSFHPWSVNLAGRSYFGASKEDALAKIGNCESYDLGLMQINSFWLPKFGVTAEDALDPGMNVILGAMVLMDCIKRYGTFDGIACYHAGSPNRTRGKVYATRVVNKWRILNAENPGQKPEASE